MNNEKNDSNNALDPQPNGENPQNQYDFSKSAHSFTENSKLNPEETSEEKIPLTEEINPISPIIETKKKNPYKIAFYVLGGVIILGSASFFGYKYLNKQQEIPVEINQCLDTDTKIYDAYKDAVVLIKHRYGYFAKINGKEFQLTVPEATEETIYGTGFFVDREGSLLTNTHVLQPWSSKDTQNEKIQTNISNMRMKIASILTTDVSEDGYESFILRNWGNANIHNEEEGDYTEYDGETENNSGADFVASSESQVDSATAETDIAASIPQKDYISEEKIEVYMKTIDISVALHDSNEEWLNCSIVKISDDSKIDLGVLQLLDQKTPESVTNIINLDNMISDDKSLKPGEKAIMVGYPLGVDLAQTNSGIKVQLYDGQISKESDGNEIQYSITSTHGASGSPVFNNCGQLIAVNFSGVDEIQGFNFGIVAKQIQTVFKTKVGEIKSNN